MAKLDDDEIGKPGKPPKVRRFPWRLWLYALAMTAGAGAGGYYWWQQRQVNKDAESCHTSLAKAQTDAADVTKTKTDCIASLNDKIQKNKDLETQMTTLASNLSASKDEIGAVRSQ